MQLGALQLQAISLFVHTVVTTLGKPTVVPQCFCNTWLHTQLTGVVDSNSSGREEKQQAIIHT